MHIINTRWLVCLNILIATGSIGSCAPVEENTINGEIVFQSNRDGNYDLYVMNPDGSNLQNLTNSPPSITAPNSNTDPASSPDGKNIAFVSNRDWNSEIYIIDVEEKKQVNLTRNNDSDFSPTWSPDGKHIAFISDRDAVLLDSRRDIWTNDIYIMDSNGSNIFRVTDKNKTDSYGGLAWSPDGKKIALCLSSYTYPEGINLLNLNDNSMTKLTFDNLTLQSCSPKWSPDGEKIAYSVYESNLVHIYIMNSDGTGQLNLSKSSTAYDIGHSWSPDGKYIVFSSRRNGSYHIFIMNADGSNPIQLTNGSDEETFPIWLPVR